MNEKELNEYYNKFNEDKRLNTKHGRVEFLTAMKYIKEYAKKIKNPKIIDIGAGTGKYSIELDSLGYDVTAVELVKHNLRVIEQKSKSVKSILGNAKDLSMFEDNSFDIAIVFGPMYHLITIEEKLKALEEVKRIVKKDGIIFISYCMNEYAVITYGFKENNIVESINKNLLDDNFHCISKPNDLYSFVRLEDIDFINKKSNLKRLKIVAQDSCTEYMKKTINNMNEDIFNIFLKYHYSICEKKEMLGASRHILDILQNKK